MILGSAPAALAKIKRDLVPGEDVVGGDVEPLTE